MRLSLMDWHRSVTRFESFICSGTEHGFKRLFFSISDDSKHLKVDRHALMISFQEGSDEEPSFKLLSVSASASKDSKGNTRSNVAHMQEHLSAAVLGHCGGNSSDHASDARKESKETFKQLLGERRDEGVQPKPVLLCDLFHANNLCMTHASLAAFGETERDNHRQKHHRQLLQSIHDLLQLDKLKHQGLIDEVLKDNNHESIKIHTMRERVQRWLANQRNASWILEMLQRKCSDGETPVLLKWAHSCGEHATSDSARVIAKDVVEMLLMQEIIVALHFEMEMGVYFEHTSAFHGSPGELCKRSGFRVMELHSLWFEFVCPWWQSSLVEPAAKNFKRTFAEIEKIQCNELQEKKRKQVMKGILAGHSQIVKLSDILLSVPVIFACLCEWSRGPSLARAMLHAVKQSSDLSWMEFEFDGQWRRLNRRNQKDKQMHALIENDAKDVCSK